MPITYDVDEDQNFVLVKVSGEYTDELLLQFGRDIIADRRIKPGFRGLFDARAVHSAEVSEEAIDQLLEMERAAPRKFKGSRRALVFRVQPAWATAKRFKDRTEESVIVVNSLGVARMWLGIKEE
jgi:hypothetical protein